MKSAVKNAEAATETTPLQKSDTTPCGNVRLTPHFFTRILDFRTASLVSRGNFLGDAEFKPKRSAGARTISAEEILCHGVFRVP
jgi:hypothetical protein